MGDLFPKTIVGSLSDPETMGDLFPKQEAGHSQIRKPWVTFSQKRRRVTPVPKNEW